MPAPPFHRFDLGSSMTSITPQWPKPSHWARRAHHDSCDARVLHLWVSFYPELTPKELLKRLKGCSEVAFGYDFFNEHGGEKKHVWWTFDTNLPWRYETSGSYQSVWCTIHESFSAHQPPKRKLPWNKVLLKKGSDMVPINNRLLMLPWFFRGVPWLVPGRNTMWKKNNKQSLFHHLGTLESQNTL